MFQSPTSRFALIRLVSVVVTTAVVAASCSGPDSNSVNHLVSVPSGSSSTMAEPRATPQPPFTSIDAASAFDVLQYAATLEFVDEHSRVDTATVTVGSSHALIRISPEIGARRVTIDSLKRGRITARWMRFPDSVQYPMPTMHGFIWTDSVPAGWRLIYFPDNVTLPRAVTSTFASNDSTGKEGFPLARSNVVSDTTVGPLYCYYTDKRWVCLNIGGLTQAQVDDLYIAR